MRAALRHSKTVESGYFLRMNRRKGLLNLAGVIQQVTPKLQKRTVRDSSQRRLYFQDEHRDVGSLDDAVCDASEVLMNLSTMRNRLRRGLR